MRNIMKELIQEKIKRHGFLKLNKAILLNKRTKLVFKKSKKTKNNNNLHVDGNFLLFFYLKIKKKNQ